ncbi:hypothetical protein J3E68DRAFT_280793 [Trichoderma sp. SZMC 28012]
MCPYEASGLGFSSATLIIIAYLAPRLSCLRTRVTRLRTYSHLSHLVLAVRVYAGCLAASFFSDLPCQLFLVPSQDQVSSPCIFGSMLRCQSSLLYASTRKVCPRRRVNQAAAGPIRARGLHSITQHREFSWHWVREGLFSAGIETPIFSFGVA